MTTLHRRLAGAAAILALAAVGSESGTARASADVLAREIAEARHQLSALELARLIVEDEPRPVVLDLRPEQDFRRFHVPSAQPVTLENLPTLDLPRDRQVALYADDSGDAALGWVLLRMRGYRNAAYLRGGTYEWLARVHEPRLAVDASPSERREFETAARFSRYFGGDARAGVPRSEVPVGYWSTGRGVGERLLAAGSASRIIDTVRRRGC